MIDHFFKVLILILELFLGDIIFLEDAFNFLIVKIMDYVLVDYFIYS